LSIVPINICQTLRTIFSQSNGQLGSDGDGGSLNGELSDASCKAIVAGLKLDDNDVLANAVDRNKRMADVLLQIHANTKSERYPRASRVREILCEEGDVLPRSSQLYSILINTESTLINNNRYVRSTMGSVTKSYVSFNSKLLSEVGKSESEAICHKATKKALIAPSYCKKDKQILLGLIYEDKKSNSKHVGVVYDIDSNGFLERAILPMFDKFDYELSLPFDVTEVKEVCM